MLNNAVNVFQTQQPQECSDLTLGLPAKHSCKNLGLMLTYFHWRDFSASQQNSFTYIFLTCDWFHRQLWFSFFFFNTNVRKWTSGGSWRILTSLLYMSHVSYEGYSQASSSSEGLGRYCDDAPTITVKERGLFPASDKDASSTPLPSVCVCVWESETGNDKGRNKWGRCTV